jgi:ABC-type Na+ efflux pump permease subunit
VRLIWNAAEKDLRRYARDPLALVMWMGIPLLIGGLISLVVGGDRPPPTAHLLVADEDGGTVGSLLERVFGSAGDARFLRVEPADRQKGRARIERGEASALLVIPEGFTTAVLNEEPTTLLLVSNPSQQILPQMIEESLQIASDGGFYAHRIFGPQLKQLAEMAQEDRLPLPNEEMARLSVSINEIMNRIGPRLFPPVIRVEAAVDQPAPQQPVNFAQLFLPGVIVMALIFMAQGLSDDLWRERAQGTLRRSAFASAPVAVFLAGKTLAATILILLTSLAALALGMWYHQIPMATLPLAVVWATSSGIVILLFFLLLQLCASTQRAGSILISSITMPLLFLGGSFFPFEAMPDWMAALGRRTPNGWALSRLEDIVFNHFDFAQLAIASAALVAAACVLFLLTERRLRSMLSRG